LIVINSYRGVPFQNEWLEKVIIQLNKDLSLAGFDKVFDEKETFKDFQFNCVAYFEHLLAHDDLQLYNLLYRIDVDQKKIYGGHGKPQLLIAQLVIEREFQKVVLKTQFS
jgi:hypothetical protein